MERKDIPGINKTCPHLDDNEPTHLCKSPLSIFYDVMIVSYQFLARCLDVQRCKDLYGVVNWLL